MPPRSRKRICLHDLVNCFEVRARDRVFETATAATNKLAGVDVDRDQRLGLIDHEIAAGLQPHARLDRLIDLNLHSVSFEYRLVFRVKLDALHQARLNAIDKLDNRLVLLLRIDADRLKVVRQLIAQQPLNQIKIAMDQRRRFRLLSRALISSQVRTR